MHFLSDIDDFDSSYIQFQEKQIQIQMQYEQKLHYSRGDGWVKLRLGVLSLLDRLYFLRVCPMSITYNVLCIIVQFDIDY